MKLYHIKGKVNTRIEGVGSFVFHTSKQKALDFLVKELDIELLKDDLEVSIYRFNNEANPSMIINYDKKYGLVYLGEQ